MQTARRRAELLKDEQKAYIRSLPLPKRIWARLWGGIYNLVSLMTYIGIIGGLVATAYWSFWSFDWKRALIGGLCTLLTIYVNKVNPK